MKKSIKDEKNKEGKKDVKKKVDYKQENAKLRRCIRKLREQLFRYRLERNCKVEERRRMEAKEREDEGFGRFGKTEIY